VVAQRPVKRDGASGEDACAVGMVPDRLDELGHQRRELQVSGKGSLRPGGRRAAGERLRHAPQPVGELLTPHDVPQMLVEPILDPLDRL
jgi:hypothetical protein